MDSRSDQEHALLHLRIDELERRLAQLEEEIRPPRGDDSPPPTESDGLRRDPEDDGARLVVIEMLTAGYEPEQISTYLRQTFGVQDAEALLAEARPVPG